MEIALEDLAVESIGIAKVRARLVDLQVRSLHIVSSTNTMVLRFKPLTNNPKAICTEVGQGNEEFGIGCNT